jgi:hypothetical protein
VSARRYLQPAGYRTLDAQTIAELAAGRAAFDGRCVALTFDDGHASVTEVAAPLLQKFGARGIAFGVPGHVPEHTRGELAGWRELRRAVALGALEVSSHSLYHHCVPVSPQVIGFATPPTPLDFHATHPIGRIEGAALPEPGAPILLAWPRYAVQRAFTPDPASLETCLARVRDAGPGFFEEPGRERRLRVVYKGSLDRSGPGSPTAPALLQRLPFDLLQRLAGPQQRPLRSILRARARALLGRV